MQALSLTASLVLLFVFVFILKSFKVAVYLTLRYGGFLYFFISQCLLAFCNLLVGI